MKVTQFTVLALCLLCAAPSFGQKKNYALERRNMVELTSAGLGLHVSGSYGRVIQEYPNGFLGASLGFGRTFGRSGFSIPHQSSINIGGKDKFIELGLGGTFWRGMIGDTRVGNYHLSPLIGFRKIFYNHYYMRITFDPLIRVAGDPFIGTKRFVPFLGGSFGYTFDFEINFKKKRKKKEEEVVVEDPDKVL